MTRDSRAWKAGWPLLLCATSAGVTGAALDRLTHRGTILETAGESYRLQDAKRRRRSEPKT
jgi:hypothetical protein